MTELSPAAQAVLGAAFSIYEQEEHLYLLTGKQHAALIAAATLRAAGLCCSRERRILMTLADELDPFKAND